MKIAHPLSIRLAALCALCSLAGASHAAQRPATVTRPSLRARVRACVESLKPGRPQEPQLSIAQQQAMPVIYTTDKATISAYIPAPSREQSEALALSIVPKLEGLETVDKQGKIVSYRISADPKRFTKEEIRSMFYPYVPNNWLARFDARWGNAASGAAITYAIVHGLAHPVSSAAGALAGGLFAMPLSYALSAYFGHMRYDKFVVGSEGKYSNGQREGESHHLVPSYQVMLSQAEDARKGYLSSWFVLSLPATIGALEAFVPFGPTKAFAQSFMLTMGVSTRALVRLSASGHRASHQYRGAPQEGQDLPAHAYRNAFTEWAQKYRLFVGRHVELHHKGGHWQQSFRLSEPFPFPGGQAVEAAIKSGLNGLWKGGMALAPKDSSYVELGGDRFSQWLSNAWSLKHLRKTGQLAFDWLEFPDSMPDSVMKEILDDKTLARSALAPAFWTVMTRNDRPQAVPARLAAAIQKDPSIVPDAFRARMLTAIDGRTAGE